MTPVSPSRTAISRRRLLALAGCLGVPAIPGSLKAAEGLDCCNFTCDVAVIGGGAAGLAAAIAAHEAGARVLVIEKMPMVGGNSLLACEAMLYADDPKDARSAAERGEIMKERKAFLSQVLARGKTGHEDLGRILIEGSPDAVKWLQSLGCNLSERTEGFGFEHIWELRPANRVPLGVEVMRHLLYRAEQHNIPVLTRMRATELERGAMGEGLFIHAESADGRIVLVEARDVVLATGGFAGSLEAVSRLCPKAPVLMTTNAASATGDGLRLANDLGAKILDLDSVVMQPTTLPLSGEIIPMALRREGAILVNADGKRFVNELAEPEVISQAMLEQPGASAWLLIDRSSATARALRDDLLSPVYFHSDDSILELSATIDADFSTLATTLDCCRRTRCLHDCGFERPRASASFTMKPFYSIKVRPAYHGTPGGIAVDAASRVEARNGGFIPRLYAAGETTGGLWGRERFDNLGLSGAIVFGRIAGANAARNALAESAQAGAAPAIQAG
ncbi:FAD-dependent oxidoreductase [Sutterella seckii]|uniref:FAD-dependent oxidoreductase n=1 Tax=Sutterella seckii TaxID=1944635 RepID=A0AAI9S9V6_9BURK|nr:FAD-dependent oxidoreductase [Sutterella seckii]KAB7649921.1 FAD-dependent oxidoreductase [Sutterella seckii]